MSVEALSSTEMPSFAGDGQRKEVFIISREIEEGFVA